MIMNDTDGAQGRERHVVVGAGPVGTAVARILAGQGTPVRLITRSGSGPDHPGVECVRADASDAAEMRRLAGGAAAIYNCANPPYHQWPQLWPPIAASLLAAAEDSGAVLVTISNLYGYGPASASLGVRGYDAGHPMTESTPLAAAGRKGQVRAQMWRDALAAHQAGRVRVTEIRASDYVGPGAGSAMGDRAVTSVLGGKAITTVGRADLPHTWTYTGDVARLAVRAAGDERAWGHAWHTPSNPPRTQREVVDDIARTAGLRPVSVRAMPLAMIRIAGVVSPLMRELAETEYQFSQDFVMDSSAAQRTFGLDPASWDAVLAEAVRVRSH
jgi:nucleoside-diphosphate-sugar epimerase